MAIRVIESMGWPTHQNRLSVAKAVHMIAAKPGTNVEWESFWASSTFEIGEASASSSH